MGSQDLREHRRKRDDSHRVGRRASSTTTASTIPLHGNELGEFTDPTIQSLYDQLVAQGSASLDDALEVGAFIEELDISDLRVRSDATDVAALTALYAKLERGSRNHLRAFTSQLEMRDLEYEPTQLDSGGLRRDRVQPDRTWSGWMTVPACR